MAAVVFAIHFEYIFLLIRSPRTSHWYVGQRINSNATSHSSRRHYHDVCIISTDLGFVDEIVDEIVDVHTHTPEACT